MESQKLESNYQAEQARLEQQVQVIITQQARQEAAAKHERQLEELRQGLRGGNEFEREKGIQQLIERGLESRGGGLFTQIGRVIDLIIGFV